MKCSVMLSSELEKVLASKVILSLSTFLAAGSARATTLIRLVVPPHADAYREVSCSLHCLTDDPFNDCRSVEPNYSQTRDKLPFSHR